MSALSRSFLRVVVAVSILAVSQAFAHVEDSKEFPSLGKEKDLARPDLEFRLPSTEIRGYSIGDFKEFSSVLMVGIDSSQCRDADFVLRLGRAQKALLPSKSMRILVLDVASAPDREKIAMELKALPVVYLFDHLQTIAPSFDLVQSGDFILADPSTLEIKRRGNLKRKDDGGPLPKELVSALAKPSEAPVLCGLKREIVKIENFNEDFLRPFSRACLGCHIASETHDNFKTLDQVLGWRAMSLRTIRLGRMPGRYDPYYNLSRSPSERADIFFEPTVEDLRKVNQWLSSSTQVTDEMRTAFLRSRDLKMHPLKTAPLSLPVKLTLTIPEPVQVPAEGLPRFKNTFVGQPLKEDITLQGLFLRTNLSVVHHTTVLALDPKIVDGEVFAKSAEMNYQFLGQFYGPKSLKDIVGFLDGKEKTFTQVFEPVLTIFGRRGGPVLFPNDSAVTLKKGTQIAIQMHMEPSGKDESAPLSFDLLGRASNQPFSELRRISMKPEKSFRLKAGERSYIVTSRAKFDRAIVLKVISVHTHYRGVAARFQIESPKRKRRTIASIPFMQVKMDRRLGLPNGGLEVEAGSTLISEIEYDNSDRNLANPKADRVIELRGRTFEDEMFYPRFQFIEK